MFKKCKPLLVAASVLLCVCVVSQARAAHITVFAAASTTNALTEIAKVYEAEGKGEAALSFASSSTLAKQIESGAPAARDLNTCFGMQIFYVSHSLEEILTLTNHALRLENGKIVAAS